MYTVTITSQGQISIPAKLRRELKLDKHSKANVIKENGRLIIEPIPDLLSMEGIFHDKALKGKTLDEIIALEERAWEEAVVERYHKK